MGQTARWMKAAEFLEANPGVGRASFYAMAKSGKLDVVKVGRRLLVREDALDRFAERQAMKR